MPAEPYGAAEMGPMPVLGPALTSNGWLGRKGARCAATVRDAESLVKVQMTHVGAETAWTGESEHCVQVGSVNINLTTGVVNHVAQLDDAFLEHAVRGGIGHHDRGKLIMIFGDFVPQVRQVDSTIGSSLDHDNLQARHGC